MDELRVEQNKTHKCEQQLTNKRNVAEGRQSRAYKGQMVTNQIIGIKPLTYPISMSESSLAEPR